MVPLDFAEWARWRSQAQHTLASGKQDLKEGDYDWASFKAHQAAEFLKWTQEVWRGLGSP